MRAANDAHLALSGAPHDGEPIIEIFLGGWGNTKSVIRRNKTKPEKAENSTPNILNAGEYRGFWIRAQNGVSTSILMHLICICRTEYEANCLTNEFLGCDRWQRG